MDKLSLLRGLNSAYKIAHEKECICRAYKQEKTIVNHKIEDLGETKIWQRLLVSIPIFIIIAIFFVIADTNYISGLPYESQPYLHRLFSVLFYISFGVLIIAQKLIKRVLPHTNWYKSRHTVLIAEEKEIDNRYRPVISAKTHEGLSALPGLGAKYHTTNILGNMIDYAENGRADTIKELIQAYETDCHRNRVESNQDRILYELAQHQNELDQLADELNYVKYYC